MKSVTSRINGFTLIELMIVLGILGVLAAVAIPAYQRSVIKTNRSDAIQELEKAMFNMELCRSQTLDFDDPACPDYSGAGQLTASGLYTITESNTGVSTITLTATATDPLQQKDTECYHFIVDQIGNHISKDNSATPQITADCW